MFNEPAVSMSELELESAALLPSRQTLMVLRWHHAWGGGDCGDGDDYGYGYGGGYGYGEGYGYGDDDDDFGFGFGFGFGGDCDY